MRDFLGRSEDYFIMQQKTNGNIIECTPMLINGTSVTTASSYDYATTFNSLEKAHQNVEMLNAMSRINETTEDISYMVVKRTVETEIM